MQFYVHQVQSPYLKGLVEYVLFNYNEQTNIKRTVTSYANTNICLGIIREKQLVQKDEKIKSIAVKNPINAYLSGMYLAPHHFELTGTLDEICIDFTPLGYYHFFKLPAPTYLLEPDILAQLFGAIAIDTFAIIFQEKDFRVRGQLVEQFLLTQLKIFNHPFLQESLQLIHQHQGDLTIRALNQQLKCSEKKLIRTFKRYFHLSPKAYLRIVKFRKALQQIHFAPFKKLTQIAYESGYYDQSHFIKEFQFFTKKSPRQLQKSLQSVQKKVIIEVK